MSFPFPRNPVDGQVVTHTYSDGTVVTAKYNGSKNEWYAERTRPNPSTLTLKSGTAYVVQPGTDGQVLTYDQASNQWIGKTPSATSGGKGQTYVKGVTTDLDTPNPPDPTSPRDMLRAGALQSTAENLHKELKVWDGTAWVNLFTEDSIKQWIAAGSLFRSTLDQPRINTLPIPATANRGYYWTWSGASGYVVTAADTPLAPSLLGEVLNPGDWLQSDGTVYQHVSGDLLSKQRWTSLGSFLPWSDTSWESGSVVSYQKAFFRSTANIVAGDAPPGDGSPGNKWVDITPLPHINTGDLSNVNANTTNPGLHGMVFQWDDNIGEWVASDTLEVSEVKTNTIIVGADQKEIADVADVNLDSVPASEDLTTVPSVFAVKDYIAAQPKPFLEELEDCTDLSFAADGEVPSWDDANSKWVPAAVSTALSNLTDVDLTTAAPTDGQQLKWDATGSKWIPTTVSTVLSGLTDVDLKTVAQTDGQYLKWDATANKWVPTTLNLAQTGGVGEWKPATNYPQNGLVLYANSIWLATAAIPPNLAPGQPLTAATITVGTQRSVATFDANSQPGSTNIETLTEVPQVWNVGDYWLLDTTGITFPYTIHGGILDGVVVTGPGRVFVVDKDGTDGWLGRSGAQYVPDSAGVTTSFTTNPGGFNTNPWKKELDIGYTKAEVDSKLSTLVSGISHGEAVQAIQAAPPPAPVVDELYIVAASATGAWAGQDKNLAYWDGAAWQFLTPQDNETHLVEDQGALFNWNGINWVKIANTAAATGSSAQHGVGEIIPWLADALPDDYLPCDGRVVAIGTYADLHAVIGNKYNTGSSADGTSTFALPDLRGYFLRGTGSRGGESNIGVAQSDTTRLPRTDFVGTAASNGAHTHLSGVPVWNEEHCFYGYHDGMVPAKYLPNHDGTSGRVAQTNNEGGHTHNVTLTGGDPETRPKSISVQWVIRYRPINGGAAGPKGDPGNDSTLLGTITQSILTESQFKTQLGTADATKWVLADGRDVTGTLYATVTGNTSVPDLRGAFLRMAGQNSTNAAWNGGGLNSFYEDTTRRPRQTAFTTDADGEHFHQVTVPFRRADVSSGWSGAGDLLVRHTSTAGTAFSETVNSGNSGIHHHTITGGGDAETTPRNYTVNYFIKVN